MLNKNFAEFAKSQYPESKYITLDEQWAIQPEEEKENSSLWHYHKLPGGEEDIDACLLRENVSLETRCRICNTDVPKHIIDIFKLYIANLNI